MKKRPKIEIITNSIKKHTVTMPTQKKSRKQRKSKKQRIKRNLKRNKRKKIKKRCENCLICKYRRYTKASLIAHAMAHQENVELPTVLSKMIHDFIVCDETFNVLKEFTMRSMRRTAPYQRMIGTNRAHHSDLRSVMLPSKLKHDGSRCCPLFCLKCGEPGTFISDRYRQPIMGAFLNDQYEICKCHR